jgi:hypothetical protein
MSTSSQQGFYNRREASLHRAYSVLSQIPSFGPVSRDVNEDKWVRVNLLLDQGHSETETAKRMDLNVSVVALIKNPRRCLELYEGDPEALRKCIEGSTQAGGQED